MVIFGDPRGQFSGSVGHGTCTIWAKYMCYGQKTCEMTSIHVLLPKYMQYDHSTCTMYDHNTCSVEGGIFEAGVRGSSRASDRVIERLSDRAIERAGEARKPGMGGHCIKV